MRVGDKVVARLDDHIKLAKKAGRNSCATKSVIVLWESLNGRTGTICEIDGDKIWVKGPQGIPRMFYPDALELVKE